MNISDVINKLKELVQKGNVSRILVRRSGEVVLNIPVSVGVAGAVVGLAAAKWALIAAALATFGFGCTVEIVKQDGQVVEVVKQEDSQRFRDAADHVIDSVKDAVNGKKNDD